MAVLSQDAKNRLRAALADTGMANDVIDKLNAIQALSSTESSYIDAVTAGTAAASKAVVLDASSQIDTFDFTGRPKLLTGRDFSTRLEHREDFLDDAGGTLPGLWVTNAETVNSTEDYVTDSACGVYTLTHSSNSEGQAMQITSGNNHWIDLTKNPIIEFRVKIDLAGAALTADQRIVIGVAGDHTNAEDTLEDMTGSAWFRMEGANLNIYVEADDGTTDTNDQDSTIDFVDNTWTIFKIDLSTLTDVKFYVDGVEQGGAAVSAPLLTGNVSPIVCIQRDAGAEEDKVYIDYIQVNQDR
ncbi:MAG: LamG-like jellyroll fold domain-containing protein [Planctomycetota bacterium]|jgi:hypothetical protein